METSDDDWLPEAGPVGEFSQRFSGMPRSPGEQAFRHREPAVGKRGMQNRAANLIWVLPGHRECQLAAHRGSEEWQRSIPRVDRASETDVVRSGRNSAGRGASFQVKSPECTETDHEAATRSARTAVGPRRSRQETRGPVLLRESFPTSERGPRALQTPRPAARLRREPPARPVAAGRLRGCGRS